MQRFDVFFKKAFSRYRESFLALLSAIIPEGIGSKVVRELPVEIVKGALRVDKIFKTDKDVTILVDFEISFTLDAYFEILTHASAHIHSTKAYKSLLEEKQSKIMYLPLLIAIKTNKKHMQSLYQRKVVVEDKEGTYKLLGTPFYSIYLLVLTEINLAEYMLKLTNLCEDEKECKELSRKIQQPEFWSSKLTREDPKLKKVLNTLLEMFGELIILLNPSAHYVFRVWHFASEERKNVSKDILNSMLILFSKEVKELSASQILTKKEKKELLEAMGIKEAIDAVGIEKVIETVGIERVIEGIGKALNLSKEDKKVLLKIIEKRKNENAKK